MSDREILWFEVPGKAVPTARVRHSNGSVATPRTTAEYQAKVAKAARQAAMSSGWPACYAGKVHVEVSLRGANPQSDPDNILKSVMDGLVKGYVLKDDCLAIVRQVSVFVVDGDLDPQISVLIRRCS
jgi:Holliday junction resolvase RusA-like endonuclease